MKVRETMTKSPASCRPQDSANRAAQLMWEHDCGVLPVLDKEDTLVGVVTDRDICMGAYTRGGSLAEISVADVMSRDVETCGEKDSVRDALKAMGKHRVRRLPVLDAKGHLKGLLSVNDVLCAAADLEDGSKHKSLAKALIHTLEAVSEHRGRDQKEAERQEILWPPDVAELNSRSHVPPPLRKAKL